MYFETSVNENVTDIKRIWRMARRDLASGGCKRLRELEVSMIRGEIFLEGLYDSFEVTLWKSCSESLFTRNIEHWLRQFIISTLKNY